jgi:hypothetical protein
MPFEIRHLGNRGHYEVINVETGEVHAKDTTLKKAKAQMRLLSRLGGVEASTEDAVTVGAGFHTASLQPVNYTDFLKSNFF